MLRKIRKKARSFFRKTFFAYKEHKRVFRILPDDVFLVSYPKSGSTWLRFMIGNYLTNNQCTITNCHDIVPDIHYNREQCAQLQSPRFIKSHASFTPNLEYPKVVYVARDGRDVAVSYYFHAMKFGRIDKTTPFEDFLILFHEGTLDKFPSWSEHVNSWLDHSPEQFLLLRYEDMKVAPSLILRRILEFAGEEVNSEKLTKAVEASSFEKMKALEQREQQAFEVLKNSDQNIPFMRKGESGGWKDFFNDDLHREFVLRHQRALERLNYV